MKSFAVILFLTIIGLSVTSQMWERTGDDMSHICQTTHSGCDDGCCTDCCSPFHTCSHCHGFTVSELLTDTALICCDFNPALYIQSRFSLFCGDIWQPPKI